MSTPAAFSVHPTPIGEALVVVTDQGLAFLDVLDVALGAREGRSSGSPAHCTLRPSRMPGRRPR